MIWLFFLGLQFYIIFSGVRQQEHDGTWSWPMFFFAIGFILFETVILTLPIVVFNRQSPWFWWIYAIGWIVAASNFVWFLRVCRRWKPKPR